MIKRLMVLLIVGSFCFAIQNCTYRAWYEGFKVQQRQACYKIDSSIERQECLDRVDDMTYDQYTKEREDNTKQVEKK